MDFIRLSKEISYALRHAPWEYELELDEFGWVNINQLLESLHLDTNWQDLKISDIQKMIDLSDKKRHELSGDRIRALYGHTTPDKIKIIESEPPEILYHGTARQYINNINKLGLLPMGRHYVHLSIDIENAIRVGKRKDSKPVILKIESSKAYKNGIKFFKGNDKIWLTDRINTKYIIFEK